MDIYPKRTDQLLMKYERTPTTYDRCPTFMISSCTNKVCSSEPRPIRTKELLQRHQQDELIRQTASASKIGLQKKQTLKIAVNKTTISNLPRPTPSASYISAHTEILPLRTKELLARQRQEDLASASKIPSTTSTKRLNIPTQTSSIRSYIGRQLIFAPTPEKTAPALSEKIKRLASQLQQVQGLEIITESKLRQLTIVDFVSILSNTLPFTGVIARDFRLNKSNYVENTIHALNRLKYPHRVHKSHLIMPGAKHGLSAVIDIIDFLLDFAVVGNMSQVFELTDNEEFKEVANAYRKWPGKKNDLLPYLVYTDLTENLDSLKKDLDNFELNPELAKFLSAKASIEQKLITLENDLKELVRESSQLTKKIDELSTDNYRIMETIESLQLVVENQSDCQFSYRSELNRHAELKNRQKFYRYQWQEFKERFQLLDHKLKRSRKELLEHTEAFNLLVRDIQYSTVLGVSYNNLELRFPISMDQIENRRLHLEEIKKYWESIAEAMRKRLKELMN